MTHLIHAPRCASRHPFQQRRIHRLGDFAPGLGWAQPAHDRELRIGAGQQGGLLGLLARGLRSGFRVRPGISFKHRFKAPAST
jgi:hypothetical protein